MGYIIPVQPIQSQIYANRMSMDDYNFAYVSNINGVKMKSTFDEHLEDQEQVLKDKEDNDEKSSSFDKYPTNPPLFKTFIQPNPVNLSPKIAQISGKGNSINLYI
ncbi:hypothetical protein AM499_10775 [Bacillus sp. FJAT-22090]|uniref:hypothetical protein n=1 Tax=Bacillus sp. FJAT-22090 TaxID=1581038 RepID=UPI0006AFC1E6|nr:hypothetical protein [Bacillus sp. FJAT-22090]ALC86261.1 hypothetical protein AM499_10775 [Bacillus sp. FJAT-22090]